MDKIWSAKWIQDPSFLGKASLSMLHKEMEPRPELAAAHPEELRNRHMLVRKVWSLETMPSSAYLDITADDYYKLYVNGRFVAQGPAQGYPFHYFYNRLDVRPYLAEGENVVAVHVYYQGLINRAYNSGDLRQGLIAELVADGEVLLGTDGTWKYAAAEEFVSGGTVGYETQYLENIDARLVKRGWRDTASLYDDSNWQPCAEVESDHTLVLQPTPTLSVYEKLPVRVEELAPMRVLIDFGTEVTGQLFVRARGAGGDVIEVRCAEELEEDGRSAKYRMRCNCTYAERWTLSDSEEWDVLEFYDYKAFRYAELEWSGEDVRVDWTSLRAVVRHYPMEEGGCTWSSSDSLVDRIWDICRNGVIYGSQENFVDCPSREKGQYLGDNTIIGHAHMYLSGDLRLVRKSLEDFARSTALCPGMLAVAPGSFMQEIADFSLQWPMQLWQYYRQSGDRVFLAELYPVALGILEYFARYEQDGLLRNVTEKWNLVDWPENLRDEYDFPLTKPVGEGCHSVINAFYYGCMAVVQDIETELGVPFEDRLPLRRKAYREAFYRESSGLFVDAVGSSHSSLHANALSLLFGLVPEEAKGSVVALLREKRFSCGVYMAYFVLKALAKAGEYELVYDLISSEDTRSWGNMVREGATTCFEAWGKDQKWNTSLCHPWASAPIPVLIEDIVGLQPGRPGWTEIRFAPRIPTSRLERFELTVQVASGVINVRCEQGQLSIEAPPHVKVVRAGV
ncbi:family 78 glycoside hydrolase catalytic domain [Paenibacillus koleovorans]|uniref:family 78 glycoside hydrolase catalytic domain n=1 Tax=Paenibacillus koleovorans TaxID=121608 RepID=UPI000FDC7588|nr:family 78 glycoside hydrolase catalytic domain [Paenibacillus koleovorans]